MSLIDPGWLWYRLPDFWVTEPELLWLFNYFFLEILNHFQLSYPAVFLQPTLLLKKSSQDTRTMMCTAPHAPTASWAVSPGAPPVQSKSWAPCAHTGNSSSHRSKHWHVCFFPFPCCKMFNLTEVALCCNWLFPESSKALLVCCCLPWAVTAQFKWTLDTVCKYLKSSLIIFYQRLSLYFAFALNCTTNLKVSYAAMPSLILMLMDVANTFLVRCHNFLIGIWKLSAV